MCGINGILIKHPSIKKIINLMSVITQRRGPDNEGFYIDENLCVALAHNRLSIIDLSGDANQPMFSEDCRYILIFNGEIYNYKELKKLYNINFKNLNFKMDKTTSNV